MVGFSCWGCGDGLKSREEKRAWRGKHVVQEREQQQEQEQEQEQEQGRPCQRSSGRREKSEGPKKDDKST